MASRTINNQIGAFRGDLDRLTQDVRSIAKVLTDTTTDQANQVRDRIVSVTGQARKDLERMSSDVQAQGRAKLKELEDTVETRPLTSLLVAFVAGVVIGKILNH